MPAAPRPSKKAQKIADDVIGKPDSMRSVKRGRKSKRTKDKLLYEDTKKER